jgi:type III pantothenate kinase
MILVIDIGNTRIKWAALDDRKLGEQTAAAHAGWGRGEITKTILQQAARPERVVIANVGGKGIGELLREAVLAAWGVEAEFVHSTAQAGGVRNAYAEPAKLGVDRWLAMIGAHAMEKGPACIISVGTAMTIDALDGAGQHLGGVIVPGPDLMVSSLLHNTSEIAPRSKEGSIREGVFADNTLGAVRQGAVNALAALVERAVESMQTQLRETPVLFLTGGASGHLEGLIKLPHRSIADLVLRGLAVVATAT